jgi:hypothetical protein
MIRKKVLAPARVRNTGMNWLFMCFWYWLRTGMVFRFMVTRLSVPSWGSRVTIIFLPEAV